MKGVLTIPKEDAPRFRMAAHYSKVTLDDIGQEVADSFIVAVSCAGIQNAYACGQLMNKITPEQVEKFAEAQKALQALQELRVELK